ncbi:hypothetical protein [Bacteroides sp.]|uniref:hypothetical protein n=1 Tax=Bacteroides sp. TaxID=29523 RepID=UPI0023D629FA|nr:hypothetical protein [Bacteroides sp.]MDE5710168.1 hypothetical protein [Bacteroides sp.]MDE5760436.1 hypothetical protein [Bacteroides sp.]MDE6216243.1 hypothetical protein [Bacteroides sp.]
MTTIELRKSLFAEINAILDSDELTRAAIHTLRKLRKSQAESEQHKKEKQAMLTDLTEAFHQMKLMEEGKLQARPAEDLLKELEEESRKEKGGEQ